MLNTITFIAAKIGSPEYGSDIGQGAIAACIGILLVMLVLLIMIGILYLFKGVFIALDKFDDKRKKDKKEVPDGELAAITAAISEYRGDDQVKVTIKSIKKL